MYYYVSERVRREKYISTRETLTAKEVLENHFKFLKCKDEELVKMTLSNRHQNVVFNDKSEYEVVDIEITPNDELTFDYLHGIDVSEIISYNVNMVNLHNSDVYAMRYVLCKEHKDSPWLIYAWGVDF